MNTAAQLDLKHNYFAFALTLIKHISPDKALSKLGLANPYRKIQADEISEDTRVMIEMRENGAKFREIAEEFGLSTSFYR
jgi:glucokinase